MASVVDLSFFETGNEVSKGAVNTHCCRSGWRASSASPPPPPHRAPCCVFGLRNVGCKQFMSYWLCSNVNSNLGLCWWTFITLFNQSNSLISVKSAVLYFIQWGDTDTEKQDVFLECLNIAHRVTPLDRGDICKQVQKFHVWAPGLEMLLPSQIIWEDDEGWARGSTGGTEYRAAFCDKRPQDTQNQDCFKWKYLFQLCTWCIHNWEKSWAQGYKWAGNGGMLACENGVICYSDVSPD